MTFQDVPMGDTPIEEHRVVEAEIHLPKLQDLKLPDVDLAPVRNLAEQALITTLGVGVLLVRGLHKAIVTAHEAGQQAAEKPGSVSHKIVDWLHPLAKDEPSAPALTRRISVPVLPIADYDKLNEADALTALASLDAEQLQVLLDHERSHQRRPAVLSALLDRQHDLSAER